MTLPTQSAVLTAIPYMASLGAWRQWMALRLGGDSVADAWECVARGMRPRDLCRAIVAGAHGQSDLLLSAAIEGGAGVVKRGRPERWTLSGHDRWRERHLRALEAAYGSAPYFQHLYPQLCEAMASAPDGSPFLHLAWRIHEECARFIGIEELLPQIASLPADDFRRPIWSADRKMHPLYAERAFLDVIFRKGKESVLTLI